MQGTNAVSVAEQVGRGWSLLGSWYCPVLLLLISAIAVVCLGCGADSDSDSVLSASFELTDQSSSRKGRTPKLTHRCFKRFGIHHIRMNHLGYVLAAVQESLVWGQRRCRDIDGGEGEGGEAYRTLESVRQAGVVRYHLP